MLTRQRNDLPQLAQRRVRRADDLPPRAVAVDGVDAFVGEDPVIPQTHGDREWRHVFPTFRRVGVAACCATVARSTAKSTGPNLPEQHTNCLIIFRQRQAAQRRALVRHRICFTSHIITDVCVPYDTHPLASAHRYTFRSPENSTQISTGRKIPKVSIIRKCPISRSGNGLGRYTHGDKVHRWGPHGDNSN